MLTLAEAQDRFSDQIGPTVDPVQRINDACERLIMSGRWKGVQQRLMFAVNNSGILTLPREFMTVVGVRVGGRSREIANQWYEFLPHTNRQSQWGFNAQDLGDDYCIFADPPAPAFTLSASCQSTNGSPGLKVYGRDPNGFYLPAGIVVPFSGTPTTQVFSRITAIEKDVTLGQASLSCVDPVNGTTLLGLYAAGETNPQYRRYYIPSAARIINPADTMLVDALCERRHVDAISPSDILFTSSLGALKNAILALHYEDLSDLDRASMHFNKAIAILNDELKRFHGPQELGAIRIVTDETFGGEGLFAQY